MRGQGEGHTFFTDQVVDRPDLVGRLMCAYASQGTIVDRVVKAGQRGEWVLLVGRFMVVETFHDSVESLHLARVGSPLDIMEQGGPLTFSMPMESDYARWQSEGQ